MAFIEETEICERAVRRLARSRNVVASRNGADWVVQGVTMDDDEAWAVLSALPVTNSTPFGRL